MPKNEILTCVTREAEPYRVVRLPGYLIVSRGSSIIVSADSVGRLFHAYFFGRTWRIGLDGKMVEVHSGGLDTFPYAKPLPNNERDGVFEKVWNFLDGILGNQNACFDSENEQFLKQKEAMHAVEVMREGLEPEALRKQWDRFKAVYGSVPILPPDCYAALLVQVTTGCSYKKCTFCTLYENQPFEIRKPDDFGRHLRAVIEFQGSALPRWKSVFLGDANALVVPHKKLIELLDQLRNTLAEFQVPHLADSLYAFTDAAPPTRTIEEYKQLRARGLRRVYIGVETGSWTLRKWLKKSGNESSLSGTIQQLKQAELGVGLILIAGIGGRKWAEQHVQETIRVVRSYPLDAADIVYVSPLRLNSHNDVHTNDYDNSESLTDVEVWQQTYDMMNQLAGGWTRRGPKIAPYDIARFVY